MAIITPISCNAFGLETEPADFQRMMNQVLANFENVSVYRDDVMLTPFCLTVYRYCLLILVDL